MRRISIFLTMISVTILGIVVLLIAAGFIPPNPCTQANATIDARESVGVGFDQVNKVGIAISSTPEKDVSTLTSEPDGQSLLESHCAQCHLIDSLIQINKSRPDWEKALFWMEEMGVQMNDTEKDILLNYLSGTDKK